MVVPVAPKQYNPNCFFCRIVGLRIRKETVRFVLQAAFGGSGGLRKDSLDGRPSSPKAMKSKDLIVGKGGPEEAPVVPKQ